MDSNDIRESARLKEQREAVAKTHEATQGILQLGESVGSTMALQAEQVAELARLMVTDATPEPTAQAHPEFDGLRAVAITAIWLRRVPGSTRTQLLVQVPGRGWVGAGAFYFGDGCSIITDSRAIRHGPTLLP